MLPKTQLLKTLSDLLRELQLSFPDMNLQECFNHLKNIQKNDESFDSFVSQSITNLEPHSSKMQDILFSDKKVKTKEYAFLNDVALFNNALPFKSFQSENKSTKKTLIAYLQTILLMCNLHKGLDFSENDVKELASKIPFLFGSTDSSANSASANSASANSASANSASASPSLASSNSASGPLGPKIELPKSHPFNLMESVLGNPDIVKIAKELSNDITAENIDPMTMISGLVSGRPDKNLSKLVNKISKKLDQKINSGEIDKNSLETQAANILNNVDLGETLKALSSSFPAQKK